MSGLPPQPQPQDQHPIPLAPLTPETPDNHEPDVSPPPYTDKFGLPLLNTTPTPLSRCTRIWCILVSLFTTFFVYSILTSDASRASRPRVRFAADRPGVSSCKPHRPLNFGADKILAERLGYTLVEDVPEDKVPSGKGVKNGGQGNERVIVVGDVHGMYHELVSLLAKVKFNADSDYLILAGDIISKGPDSLKVLDLARGYGAGCVRGNHEDRILLHYHQLQKKKDKKHGKSNDKETRDAAKHQAKNPVYNADEEDSMEMDDTEPTSPPCEHSADDKRKPSTKVSQARTDQKLARKLSRKQAAWLDACPLVLRMKNVPRIGQVEVVHAGLVHGVRLEDQDPNAIMNMRTLDHHCHLPTAGKDGRHWADLWNWREKAMGDGGEHTTVIYGHYASMGLDIRPYTKGLDSNCIRGGRLSAFVISSKHDEVVSVKCRNYLKG